jgi:hypothetical protein
VLDALRRVAGEGRLADVRQRACPREGGLNVDRHEPVEQSLQVQFSTWLRRDEHRVDLGQPPGGRVVLREEMGTGLDPAVQFRRQRAQRRTEFRLQRGEPLAGGSGALCLLLPGVGTLADDGESAGIDQRLTAALERGRGLHVLRVVEGVRQGRQFGVNLADRE